MVLVDSSSRYAQCSVSVVTGRDGVVRKKLDPRPPKILRGSVSFHVWKEHDRVDKVAHTYYRDPRAWWRFADFNPDIFDWFDVPAGTVIRIPRVD